MKKLILFFISLIACVLILVSSCRKDAALYVEGQSGYPLEIEKIVHAKCAVEGCHNSQSATAASGLDMTTWESLFKGNRGGAVVIPYWHNLSSLFLFSNVHEDLGNISEPTMPLNRAPLLREEIIKLKEWINNGAPNADGFVKFSDNPNRKKYYVVNQGCDLVTVIDKETELQMRYVQVGHTNASEAPHRIIVAPDMQHWYVIFINSDVIQKYRTSDDSFVAQATISHGSWNTFVITPDSKTAFVADMATGRIANVDLNTMQLRVTYSGYGFPHGVAFDNNILYTLDSQGDRLFKIDVSDPMDETFSEISLPVGSTAHEITFSPDGSKYYIVAQGRDEILVFNKSDDQLITTIRTADFPQELAISKSKNLLFVTCMEDRLSFPGKIGSVVMIDIATNTIVKKVFTGFQPHGVYVDDEKGFALVANRNVSTEGPAPHHSSFCGGKNGNLSFIDLNSLNVRFEKQQELSVDPYAIDERR